MEPHSSPAPTMAVHTGEPLAWYQRVPSLKRLVLFSSFVFFLAVGTLVGGFAYIKHIVTPMSQAGRSVGEMVNPVGFTNQEEAGKISFQGRERMNLLVLGIDYNYDEKGILYTKGARSDTIFVVSLDPDAEFLNVVSIPRDTQVLIAEDIGYDKINSAYSYGGIEQAKETVSQFLGVPVDHYVIVKVNAAAELIDAIGGVPVDVEKDMDYDDNWGNLHIHLKKGPQILNGKQLVGYARFRMDEEGDRGRIRRQQQVLRALGEKLKDPSLLARIPEIAKIVKASVETDLKIVEMADLANLYQNFDFARMRTGTIVGDDAEANGISFIVPYAPENNKTVRRLLKDQNWVGKEDLRIQVLNGSDDSQAGNRLADELHLEGLQVLNVSDADRLDYADTQIIQHTNVPRARGILMSLIPGAEYRIAPAPGEAAYDVTIIVGNDQAMIGQSWSPPPRAYPVYTPEPRYSAPEPEPAEEEVPEIAEELPPPLPDEEYVPEEVPLEAPPVVDPVPPPVQTIPVTPPPVPAPVPVPVQVPPPAPPVEVVPLPQATPLNPGGLPPGRP